MPVCPKCQTPYDEWQHFCLQCGEYLKNAPPLSHPCPQCGAQVPMDQTFCRECSAALKADAGLRGRLISRWKWLTVGLIAAIVILGTIFAYYFIGPRGVPPPSADSPAAVPPVAADRVVSGAGQAPEAKAGVDTLQADVEEVLNRVKEANLTKNILLYLDNLSVLYPQVEKKRQEVFRTWGKFTFKEMAFTVDKLQEVDPNNAVAEVDWRTSAQNLTTSQLQTGNYRYRVWFTKELGQWKIKKIEELPTAPVQ
jgi:predicted nucleic acid-binding Zn ribbon protein